MNELDKDFTNFEKEQKDKALQGFELIKKFIERYPKTEYQSVDDDLLEIFCRGARLLDINYILLPEDDQICPHCNKAWGDKLGKKGLSLHTMFGNNTICHYCYVEDEYDDILKHTPASCDHPSSKGMDWDDSCNQWSKEDCSAVGEAFEHSYNAILKELFP